MELCLSGEGEVAVARLVVGADLCKHVGLRWLNAQPAAVSGAVVVPRLGVATGVVNDDAALGERSQRVLGGGVAERAGNRLRV